MVSKRDLAIQRNNTARLYRTPRTNMPCKRNVLVIRPNSFNHELEKFRICYCLLNGIGMNIRNNQLKGWGSFKVKPQEFITEALEKSTGKIRDIICLDTGEIFEIEVNKKRALRHCKNITVVMV